MTNLWKTNDNDTAKDEIVFEDGEYYLKTVTTPLRLFAASTMEGLGLRILECLFRMPNTNPDDIVDNMTAEFRQAIGL